MSNPTALNQFITHSLLSYPSGHASFPLASGFLGHLRWEINENSVWDLTSLDFMAVLTLVAIGVKGHRVGMDLAS